MEREDTVQRIDDCWNRIGAWAGEARNCPLLEQHIHCRNCPTYHNSGRLFLDRPPPEGYERDWTQLYSREKDAGEVRRHTVFVFRAGGEWLGLKSILIQEVVGMSPIHSLPHARSNMLRGITNIRGRLELCFSLGTVLGIDRLEKPMEKTGRKYVTPERLVVVERSGFRFVFPVTEVLGLARYSMEMVRELPVTVSRAKAAFTSGILHVDAKDIGILRDETLFDALSGGLK